MMKGATTLTTMSIIFLMDGKKKKRQKRKAYCQGGADRTLPWQSLLVRGMVMEYLIKPTKR